MGRIDILVNNRYHAGRLLLRMKEEDWNLSLQVNLNGTFYCTKAVLAPDDEAAVWRIIHYIASGL